MDPHPSRAEHPVSATVSVEPRQDHFRPFAAHHSLAELPAAAFTSNGWSADLPISSEPVQVRPADVRAWAARQGIWLASRGKVPVLVTKQYRAALRLSESLGSSRDDFLGV